MQRFQRFRQGWVLAVAIAAGTSATAGMAPDELFRTVSPGVWQVLTLDDAGKPIGTGSAVVIGRGSLVTNCHVLKNGAAVTVRQGRVVERAALEHADVERDLCLLSAPGVHAAPVILSPGSAQVGQRIYTIGAPRGLEATLSDGLVSGLRNDQSSGELAYLQISAPISPGSSGGGLFDDEGRLLGITTSGIVGAAQNLNFARPASMIKEIPARAQAALARWRAGQTPSAAIAREVAPSPPPQAGSRPVSPTRSRTPTVTSATQQGTEPAHITSGFAAIDDIDAIPFLSDRGRAGYRDWLTHGTPRAFALAASGGWAGAWGVRPRDPIAPVDVAERAVWNCERTARMPCKLYAVNNAVVWVK